MMIERYFLGIINKIDKFVRSGYIVLKIRKADMILMATSSQANLGDHAISIAEICFLRSNFRDKRVVEVPKELFYFFRKVLRRHIKSQQLILISGGGFLGDLWMTEEALVRDIMDDYKENPIIVFPQTVFFSKHTEEYKKSFDSYRAVKRLFFNLRDRASFEFVKGELDCSDIFCMPDMVLSMRWNKKVPRNSQVLVCLRNDKEACLAEKECRTLIERLKKRGLIVKTTSTVADSRIPISLRTLYVEKKLREFASSKLVITNRLHAMIFAAITGTPCIAIDNLSHKVSGTYDWIRNVEYVKLLDSIESIDACIDTVLHVENRCFKGEGLEKYYLALSHTIADILKR